MDWEWNGKRYSDVWQFVPELSESDSPGIVHHGPVTLFITWADADAGTSGDEDLFARRRNIVVNAVATWPADANPRHTERAKQTLDGLEGWADLPWLKGANEPVDLANFRNRLAELLEQAHERMHAAKGQPTA